MHVSEKNVQSTVPGRVLDIKVRPGDKVKRGFPVLNPRVTYQLQEVITKS